MSDSRITGFHRLTAAQRIDELARRGWLSAADAEALRQGRHVLMPPAADKIIENVLGVFGLPFAVAPNFRVNGTDRLVPMVVEEPSIVAGLSFAAALALQSGGFESAAGESLLAGQVHVAGIGDADAAIDRIERIRDELLAAANRAHPRLLQRGGGVRDIECRRLRLPDGSPAVAVHLLVDTCDAMGANLVNTICEALAPQIAAACGGKAALRILSNLADRSMVSARVVYRVEALATGDFDGAAVRDAVVLASDLAAVDPYRAATHNKGIMNGIDALAIATGNDWRAIEAGAHAFAAAGGAYRPLSTWRAGADGDLVGEIRLPLKVGTIGGTLAANPAAALGLRLSGVHTATELAGLMAAVGLAQNFAALRALATSGIQSGHMHLHARSVAAAAGVADECFDTVVSRLVAGGEIRAERAREIAAELVRGDVPDAERAGSAAGKVILLGEHAVVYGKHALALPIPGAVTATVSDAPRGLRLEISDWGVAHDIAADAVGFDAAVLSILRLLGIDRDGFTIHVRSRLPRGMGLGSSAALAVAIVRAFDAHLELGLDDKRVNTIAFECEKLAHGTPSGVDNAIATYACPMLFSHVDSIVIDEIALTDTPPILIASSGRAGLTREQVAAVRSRFDRNPGPVSAIFEQMDALSIEGARLLRDAAYDRLGCLMNICQGLLNAVGVSTPELERMVDIARAAGAAGAKLTGAGGGGSIVAICPGKVADVREALQASGYRTIELNQ